MLMLLDNFVYLALLFFAFIYIFKLFLKNNILLSKTIRIFLLLHVLLVAFILIEQHRFKTNLANSIFINDGEAYSANGWQISTALTDAIPDIQSVAQMRGIHLADRGWGLDRYYNDFVKKKIILPASEYQIGHITYFYSIIYAAYGFKPVFINFMNVILHLVTAIVIYKSVKLIFEHRTAYLSTLFFLLNPVSFYYSSTKLRDTLVVFLVYLAVFFLIMTLKKSYWYSILVFLLLYFFDKSLLKPGLFMPLLVVFGFLLMVIVLKKNKKIFLVAMIVVICSLNRMDTRLFEKFKLYVISELNSQVIHQRGFYNTGGTVYRLYNPDKDSHDYTLLDWGSYITRGWYHMLCEPIFSTNSDPKFILFFPFKLIFFVLCILVLPGILMVMRYGRHTEAAIFLALFLVIGTGLAMSSGNVGTVLRHRDLITPVIYIFSALFISSFFGNKYLKIKEKNHQNGKVIVSAGLSV